jgi:cytochrome c peroxidase
LGLPLNKAIPANTVSTYHDLGLCQRDGIAKIVPADVTPQSLCGAFKVPTLRNIAVTAPYFHNGGFTDLREAVRFYVTRDTNPERWYPKSDDGSVQKFNDLDEADKANVNTAEVPYDRKPGEAPRLDDAEIDALVAFLKTLTDRTPQ